MAAGAMAIMAAQSGGGFWGFVGITALWVVIGLIFWIQPLKWFGKR